MAKVNRTQFTWQGNYCSFAFVA